MTGARGSEKRDPRSNPRFFGLAPGRCVAYDEFVQIPSHLMKNTISRRSFAKTSALAVGALSAAPFNILKAANTTEKVRFVQIGCGGRGLSAHLAAAKDEQLVAVVDVDEARHTTARKWLQSNG